MHINRISTPTSVLSRLWWEDNELLTGKKKNNRKRTYLPSLSLPTSFCFSILLQAASFTDAIAQQSETATVISRTYKMKLHNYSCWLLWRVSNLTALWYISCHDCITSEQLPNIIFSVPHTQKKTVVEPFCLLKRKGTLTIIMRFSPLHPQREAFRVTEKAAYNENVSLPSKEYSNSECGA